MADSEQARYRVAEEHGVERKLCCAEVAFVGDSVLMRHSKNPSGPVLTFSLAEWAAFVTGVRMGEFDGSADGFWPFQRFRTDHLAAQTLSAPGFALKITEHPHGQAWFRARPRHRLFPDGRWSGRA